MAKVQRKAGMTASIKVNKRDGNTLGHFELTSGNIYYYRAGAKVTTKKYTWANLIKLIEKDLE